MLKLAAFGSDPYPSPYALYSCLLDWYILLFAMARGLALSASANPRVPRGTAARPLAKDALRATTGPSRFTNPRRRGGSRGRRGGSPDCARTGL